MQKSFRFIVTTLFLGVYLLSACSGAVPQQRDSLSTSDSQLNEVVFTGTVESMGGSQWMISAQQVTVDGSTFIDPSVQMGDMVKVEASVASDGSILATRIESTSTNDANNNSNSSNSNDVNGNDNNGNMNDNSNTNDSTNAGETFSLEQEIYGTVEAMTSDSITVDGVVYGIASFTEFRDTIVVGDQVKLHVIVNSDGTFTALEIEKVTSIGNDNSNSNGDDSEFSNTNNNSNTNSNSNDNDYEDDHSNSNSNSNLNSNGDD